MRIYKNFKGFSGWLALGALAMTVAGPVYASGQQTVEEKSDQKLVQQSPDKDVVLVAFAKPAPAPAATSDAPMYTPPSMASGSYRWTGFYLGVHIGHGAGQANAAFNPLPTAAQFVNLAPVLVAADPDGTIGGGQFGFNLQRGRFVFGGEFDISASGMSGSHHITPIIQNNGTAFPGAGFLQSNQDIDWLASLRPRVGVTLVPRLLIYGTGGLAFGHVSEFATTDFRPVGTTQYPVFVDRVKKGWIAGAGAEFGLTKRLSVRGEFMRHRLGTDAKTVNAIPALPPFQVGYRFGTTGADVFDFGVNYRF